MLDGRYAVSVEDVRTLASPVMQHRIIPNFNAEAEGIDSLQIIDKLVEEVSPGDR